jgi:hypothetical protein
MTGIPCNRRKRQGRSWWPSSSPCPPLLYGLGHCCWWLVRRWWQASRASAPDAGGIDLSRDSPEGPVNGPATVVPLAAGYPALEGLLPQGHGPRYDFSAAEEELADARWEPGVN